MGPKHNCHETAHMHRVFRKIDSRVRVVVSTRTTRQSFSNANYLAPPENRDESGLTEFERPPHMALMRMCTIRLVNDEGL